MSTGQTPRFSYVAIEDCSAIGDEVAIVVDVIRAFSFAAYTLDAGVERVILMDDLDATVALAASLPNALAGKDGAPDPRFDLFNSPGQVLERSDLHGRTVVHKTTAGTMGVFAARHVAHLFCASFVVAEATVQNVRLLEPSAVTFVITGDDGRAEEDLACADYIAARLSGTHVDPAPFLARVEAAGRRLHRAVELGLQGVHVDDLALCMDLDRFDFALRVSHENGHLVLRRN